MFSLSNIIDDKHVYFALYLMKPIYFQVIYMQALIMVLLIGKLMKKVFFGQLRATEFEVLSYIF